MPNIEEKPVDFRTWVGVLGTILGAFMAVLDIQITNSSLKDITGGIAATQDEGSWVSTSYLIGEIITIPLTAWLSRVFSVRWYLIVNVALFLIFSCLCGTARSLGEMIAYRACQGFTGGVMIPMSLTVALSTLPKSKQPLGLALFGITATLGPALGPTVGGWLTDNYGWQWVFYINLVPGALMIGSIVFAIRSAPMQLYQLRQGDWLGIGCMAIGLGSLIAMLEEGQRDDWLGSLFIQRCALLAAIFIPTFVIIELSRKKPFVNLRLLAQRNLGIASAANFFLGSVLYGTVYLLPQYLTIVQGYDAFQTGQAMIWVGLPQLLIFPFVPRLMKRLLDTIVTRREQFHDFEIGAYINAYRPVVQERVQTLATTFVNKGYDAVTATNQAYGQIEGIVRREAYVMAFNDAFLIVGISLVIGAVLVWFCQKTRAKEGAVAH